MDSYLINNLLVSRKGENIFTQKKIGEDFCAIASMNGYAILPLEDYFELKGEEYPEELKSRVEKFRNDSRFEVASLAP